MKKDGGTEKGEVMSKIYSLERLQPFVGSGWVGVGVGGRVASLSPTRPCKAQFGNLYALKC